MLKFTNTLIAFCLIVFVSATKAQNNLVPDGSFEDTLSCPHIGGNINLAVNWFEPNFKTSDLFNNCSTGGYGVPQNFMGYQKAFDGGNYAGITLFWNSVSNYREYIGIKLVNQLIKNQNYVLKLYFSHADSCNYIVNNFHAGFSPDTIGYFNHIILNPTIKYMIRKNMMNEKNDWNVADLIFKAKGNENFLFIGNFDTDNQTSITLSSGSNQSTFDFSYIYIDSVSIYPIKNEIPNVFTPNNDGINDVWTINLKNSQNSNTIIYDRWGLKVFESNYPIVIWDGRTSSGIECNNGIYFFVINTNDLQEKGFIQLIR